MSDEVGLGKCRKCPNLKGTVFQVTLHARMAMSDIISAPLKALSGHR